MSIEMDRRSRRKRRHAELSVAERRNAYQRVYDKPNCTQQECDIHRRLAARSRIFPQFMGCTEQRNRKYTIHMEYTGNHLESGGTSKHYIRGEPDRPLRPARLVAAIRLATMAMWRENVVHDDWKGANITLDRWNQYRVIDFGKMITRGDPKYPASEADAISDAIERVFASLYLPVPLVVATLTPEENLMEDAIRSLQSFVSEGSRMFVRNELPSGAVWWSGDYDMEKGLYKDISVHLRRTDNHYDIWAKDETEEKKRVISQPRRVKPKPGLLAYQRWLLEPDYYVLEKQENLSEINGLAQMLWCLALHIFADKGDYKPIRLRTSIGKRTEWANYYRSFGMHARQDNAEFFGSIATLLDSVCMQSGKYFANDIMQKIRWQQVERHYDQLEEAEKADESEQSATPQYDSSAEGVPDVIVIGSDDEREVDWSTAGTADEEESIQVVTNTTVGEEAANEMHKYVDRLFDRTLRMHPELSRAEAPVAVTDLLTERRHILHNELIPKYATELELIGMDERKVHLQQMVYASIFCAMHLLEDEEESDETTEYPLDDDDELDEEAAKEMRDYVDGLFNRLLRANPVLSRDDTPVSVTNYLTESMNRLKHQYIPEYASTLEHVDMTYIKKHLEEMVHKFIFNARNATWRSMPAQSISE